jgi:hypothetical protein
MSLLEEVSSCVWKKAPLRDLQPQTDKNPQCNITIENAGHRALVSRLFTGKGSTQGHRTASMCPWRLCAPFALHPSQVYAESSMEMMRESYPRALGRVGSFSGENPWRPTLETLR